jgi:hypothetical protein
VGGWRDASKTASALWSNIGEAQTRKISDISKTHSKFFKTIFLPQNPEFFSTPNTKKRAAKAGRKTKIEEREKTASSFVSPGCETKRLAAHPQANTHKIIKSRKDYPNG